MLLNNFGSFHKTQSKSKLYQIKKGREFQFWYLIEPTTRCEILDSLAGSSCSKPSYAAELKLGYFRERQKFLHSNVKKKKNSLLVTLENSSCTLQQLLSMTEYPSQHWTMHNIWSDLYFTNLWPECVCPLGMTWQGLSIWAKSYQVAPVQSDKNKERKTFDFICNWSPNKIVNREELNYIFTFLCFKPFLFSFIWPRLIHYGSFGWSLFHLYIRIHLQVAEYHIWWRWLEQCWYCPQSPCGQWSQPSGTF